MLNRNKLLGKMKELEITQKKMSSLLNISENTFSKRINGNGFFSIEQAERISSILGIVDGKEKAEIFLSNPSQNRDS